jgi:hypothetical protein
MRTKSFGKAVGGEESSVRAHSYLAYRVEVGAGARGDRDSMYAFEADEALAK